MACEKYGCPCGFGRDLLFAVIVYSGRGGIGRRAALRSLWDSIPWKFEASRPHHIASSQIQLRVYWNGFKERGVGFGFLSYG